MASLSRDLVLSILRNCFPRAENVRIVHNQVEEGQRHVTSEITRFVVEFEQDQVTQRKHVVVKVPTSGALFSLFERLDFYNKEIVMYEKVMPQINECLDKSLAPAHLYTTDSKILVLEDLTVRGYVSGETLSLLNLAEAKGAMKTFARFHSATHKLYQTDASIFSNYHLPSAFEDSEVVKFLTLWSPIVLELLKRKKDHRLAGKVEAALSYFDQHKDEASTLSDRSKFKFLALNHGDARKDNFLFKYTANNEVLVQFLDYQACFISSPTCDISVFLQGSVSADVLVAHFDDLIDGYLHELNVRLKKLDCATAYERADFDQDFKSLRFFSIYSFLSLCATVSPLNREQLANLFSSSTNNSHLSDACLKDEAFVRSVYGWLKYFENSKIINEF